jgi:hypothetical protein
MTGFGITQETKSGNNVPFLGGLNRGMLVAVKREEIGKNEKYNVLAFTFKDIENIKTFKHIEWVIDSNDDKFTTKLNGMNSRIKHLYETFKPFPTEGIGTKATNFEEFFVEVEKAFNTNDNGGKIFTHKKDDKEIPKAIWLKTVYNKKNEINFPLAPNFVELIKENNQNEPKTLVIDKRYDKIEQEEINRQNATNLPLPNVNGNDFEF